MYCRVFMKYIFLTGSIIFGITGISRAMETLLGEGGRQIEKMMVVFDFQFFTFSFQPAPVFVKILGLSLGFFCLFLIWRKLKKLGFKKIWEYVPN